MLIVSLILLAQSVPSQDDARRIAPIVAHRQIALVIGNGAYPKFPLRNPANDAVAMSQRLRSLNYDVTVVTDANRKAMGQAIDQFLDKLTNGDVAFFYYSGHGVQVEGENFLIPVDFQGQNETDVRYDTHSAARIQERMEKSGAQLNILVLDACRDNPFHAGSRSLNQGLAVMNGGRGTFVAFATSPGRTASDNAGSANGLFTQYLLEAMGVRGLGLDDVFNIVRARVDAASGGRQVPWSLSSVVGRYSFLPGENPPPPINRTDERETHLPHLPPSPAPTKIEPPPRTASVEISGRGFNPLSGEARGALGRITLQVGPSATVEVRSQMLYFRAGDIQAGPVSCRGLSVETGGASLRDATGAQIPGGRYVKISGSSGAVTLYAQADGKSLQQELKDLCAAAR